MVQAIQRGPCQPAPNRRRGVRAARAKSAGRALEAGAERPRPPLASPRWFPSDPRALGPIACLQRRRHAPGVRLHAAQGTLAQRSVSRGALGVPAGWCIASMGVLEAPSA